MAGSDDPVLALQLWVEASKNRKVSQAEKRRLWQSYVEANRAFKAKMAPPANQRAAMDKLSVILAEVMEQFGLDRVTDKTKVDWQRVAEVLSARLQDDFSEKVFQAFMGGIQRTGKEVGWTPEFGGRLAEVYGGLATADTVLEAFQAFGKDATEEMRDVIRTSFQEGAGRGRLITDLIDTVGWKLRPQLERIARTETWTAWETARASTYREAEEYFQTTFLYTFGTRRDGKTCMMCDAIMDAIDDEGGKKGISLDRVEEIIELYSTGKKAAVHPRTGKRIHLGRSDWEPRAGGRFALPHPNCRHGVMRVVLPPK